MDGLEFAWEILLAPTFGGGALVSATAWLGYAAGSVGGGWPAPVQAGAGVRAAGAGAARAGLRLLGFALAVVLLWTGAAALLPTAFELPRACAAWLLGSVGAFPLVAAALAGIGFAAGARARAAREARGP